MISPFLLALQVFFAFPTQGLATKKGTGCGCFGYFYPCRNETLRKHLADGILSAWTSDENKPKYRCDLQSESQEVLLNSQYYWTRNDSWAKLEHRRKGNFRYQTDQMLTDFLNESVEVWKDGSKFDAVRRWCIDVVCFFFFEKWVV
ncbi:hypothetical protein Y032_0233g3068 [Ancylostoma ceylanicum]|uniref:Uncharacterized protein n=1 Tax=Ancylostoma ceylanicum TaxID=53326 RepID=A0A016SFU6_9BILA|nr:hypothetical protein Y032_0233g3068 [Ancylostoma ceylanicum]